ncbi:LysR family transcriptional regulator [Streptococcus sciuri]|uniref:LysR family transcriptional regulator n=1 Tax=Streptococcus sciuri TaxID=2973939 RepID=A0ABT2F791_9STRE|nr:LysR family transcriptional regulator [Streptococcus sciuri]MCS4488299.1 LysR family transcriptional regulator [Streptococcus sciuri]
MNTRDLEYFHKLAELASFTMVAEFFGVSQPTITYAIKRLEEVYHCDLVLKDRSHRSVKLTAEGEILDNHIQTILMELEVAQKTIERSAHHEIRVGIPPIIRAKLLASLIDMGESVDFMTNFTLTPMSGSHILLQYLLDGELDFSLLGSLQSLGHPKLEIKEIYKRPFYIFVSKKHPLANQSQISFKDVLKESFIMLNEGHIHFDAFNKLNARYNNKAKVLFKFEDPLVIGQMVRENLGITFLTDFVLFSQMEGLVKIPLVEEEQFEFHVSYAYSKNYRLPESIRSFIQILDQLRKQEA